MLVFIVVDPVIIPLIKLVLEEDLLTSEIIWVLLGFIPFPLFAVALAF